MQTKFTPVLALALSGLAFANPAASPGNQMKDPWNWCINNWRDPACQLMAVVEPTGTVASSATQEAAPTSTISAVGPGVLVNGTMAIVEPTATPPTSTTTPVVPLNTTTPGSPSNTTTPVNGAAKDLNAPLGTVYLGMGLLAAAGYVAVL